MDERRPTRAELMAEISALKADLEAHRAANSTASCIFCDWRSMVGGPHFDRKAVLAEHVAKCQNHPMRALETSLENVRRSEDVWRKRVEAAADALADMLPGEVGRLNLLARIQALKDELARLKPTGQAAGPCNCRSVARPDNMGAHYADCPRLIPVEPSGEVAEDVKTVETYAFEIGSIMPYQKDVKAALSRLAAKAQGYEAAVTDNAALVTWIDQHGHATWCNRSKSKDFKCTDGCAAKSVTSAPHPGAALLEQHRKEVEDARVSGRQAIRRISEALVEHGVQISDPASLTAIMDGIDSVVARAMDEGLEKGAAWAEALRGSTAGIAPASIAASLRAMKTCTDGSCAKCRSGEPCH